MTDQNTYIEGKLKEFDEKVFYSMGSLRTSERDIARLLFTQALEESFTLGQKSGVELAEGVVPEKEDGDPNISGDDGNSWCVGHDDCRTETLSALSSLKETL